MGKRQNLEILTRALDGMGPQEQRCAASISGSIMGDEYTESYYFCTRCQVYTVEVYHGRFLGEDEISVRGPVSKPEGDAMVEMIKQCSELWNKKCCSEANQGYFQGSLD